jgi:hypothetical protein
MSNVYKAMVENKHYFGYFKTLAANYMMDKKICEVVRSTESL